MATAKRSFLMSPKCSLFSQSRSKDLDNSENHLSVGTLSNFSDTSSYSNLNYTRADLLKGLMLIRKEKVTILSALKVKETTFAFVASGIGMYNVSFFSSFIAIHFAQRYDISEHTMGYYFAI